ncbi:hypothetical protein JWJ90_02845 [Desulfobulbus rhabdoformis]|uniref:WcbI family polysaccharide biosynthesis putative acetyltransferase n=1 Tax=Desulfobulbus rhabdoformis TaxID=34032 RepID=UPI0019629FF2|nr:WcbI family polysaccharide biosynthesis putative acetyltransferase [Desulfobulbus rhabdoformis]MBM9613218.1 hypothetical protein [Desulfobulbus rhabdoformis]
MKSESKFAVIANCQSSPLSNFIDRLSPSITKKKIPAVHTLDKNKPEELFAQIDDVEIIIHQPIGSSFGELCIDNIKTKFPLKKYISFPSIHFDGYFPNLMYLRLPTGGTLKGTIGDYHDSRLVEAAINNYSTLDTVDMLSRLKNRSEVISEIDISLERLRAKEKFLDINVSEYIRKNLLNRRMFYVFNHPNNEILIYVAKAVYDQLSISIDEKALANCYKVPDYLNKSQAKIDSSVLSIMDSVIKDDELYANRLDPENHQVYTLEEYVDNQLYAYKNISALGDIYNFAIEKRKAIGY